MSEITPAEAVATALAIDGGGFHDDELNGWVTFKADGSTVQVKVAHHDDGEEIPERARHFRAVVVEGETDPIVLERPEELGIQRHDGGDLLALTRDGITLFPCGADEWSMSADNAREMAAHLAAMADAYEAAQAQKGGDE